MVMSVILAAGKGTRMVSDLPKVLHPLQGAPILEYVIDKVEALGCQPRAVVVGYKGELVEAAFANRGLTWAWQKEQLGTGHAASVGVEALEEEGDVLILNGDLPLLKIQTLTALIDRHEKAAADLTILTAEKADPRGYGRIVRDRSGRLQAIVEEGDADAETRRIREVNLGVYIIKSDVFRKAYSATNRDNSQNEYYLPDVVVETLRAGSKIETASTSEDDETAQVNSRQEMAEVGQLVRRSILTDFMANGVTIDDPVTTYIEKGVQIGKDAHILPFTYICRGVEIGPGCTVGPFTTLRPGTVLKERVQIGNFVEVKNSQIDAGTKAKHLAYLGDTSIGRDANVGAGTIVANYDGKKKHRTVIEERAFLGSGTILVAPVRVGKGASTGAGAVVTRGRDVADQETVVGVPAKPLRKTKGQEPGVRGQSSEVRDQ